MPPPILLPAHDSARSQTFTGSPVDDIGRAEILEYQTDHIALVPLTDGTFSAVGDPGVLDLLGNLIDELPAPMMRTIATTSTAMRGMEIAGEVTARSLALTKESAAMLEKFGVVKDMAGGTLAITREAGGKINHIARVAEVGGSAATAVASAGTVVALLAIQIQLQQISKQLGRVESGANRVGRHLENNLLARIHQRHLTLTEVARTVQLTGVLDETTWMQIAHLGDAIRVDSHVVRRKVRDATTPLRAVSGKGKRTNPTQRLYALAQVDRDDKPILWAHALFHSKRSEILMYQLEIFRRMTVNDPNLEIHRQELGRRVGESVTDMAEALSDLQNGLTVAGSKLTGYEWYDIHNFKSLDETKDFEKALKKLKDAGAEVSLPAKKAAAIVMSSAPLEPQRTREPAPIIAPVDPLTAPIEHLGMTDPP